MERVSPLFVIPLWADLLAVGVGALQGAMFAAQFRDRRLDWLGVAIIGIVVGFGGGLLRDLLLNVQLAPLQSNWYLAVATGAALLGMLLERVLSKLSRIITALDALTIGLFGAIGTTKALSLGLPPVAAVFVGVLAAVGGSILRDVLLNLPIALMHVGSLYALAAAGGAFAIALLLEVDVPVFIAAAVGVVLTFAIRILSVLFGWSLPEQRAITRLPKLPVVHLPLRRRQSATVEAQRGRVVTTATGVIHLQSTTAAIPVVDADNEPVRVRRRSPIPGASRARR
ncbi:putative membrane protein YeiH [Microcella putealis]|uniref:Putative membrane protein YeiH n=1 Tax=Microcella putealis TaxID=337005 RepID=A0A4Q7LWU5_9MICO|nr:TRIC cation channel family protein [Microcella putealis]RZS59033.1 putative membrane protein YeiH [Microcella putealis]TQM24059.1 putative membrane protein YeiH [Microcella putealis]